MPAMANSVRDLLDSLLDQQSRSWLAGKRPAIDELLGGSSLRNDSEAQLDLIYNEIVLREQLGEQPLAEEYYTRYPHLRDTLALHFEVHCAMEAGLTDTAKLMGHATKPLPGLTQPADYEIIHILGRGGMGVVYKARHGRLRRFVALKMFEPGRIPSEREVLRFRTEAETVARLQHPNIVQIFEIGERDGLPFLALELVEGGTLADRLQRLPFAPRAAAELLETLARAVHHAHKQGIIHRDLKPANVLFASDGTAKLTDFGLAKVLEDADGLRDATRTGEPIGTPRYMSPEQAAGQNDHIGPATDVYALGTLLYECLTGQVPFVSAGVIETLNRIRFDDPVSPWRLQPSIPRDLATICLNCLHKEPTRRYASANALADDLRRFLNGEPIMARPTPVWEKGWKWCRRRPTHAALVAVSVLLLVAGITAAGIRHRMEEKRIATARERVETLVAEGHEALARRDEARAEVKFQEAWTIVQGEPALRDYGMGIDSWLRHARTEANKYHWTQRIPPPEYPERRDEAFFHSLLLGTEKDAAVRSARESISAAYNFTLPNDPVWKQERERLAILEADLLLTSAGPAAALARLSAEGAGVSRLFHQRSAACLNQLERRQEAEAAQRESEKFPPDEQVSRLFAGMDGIRKRDFAAAARDFEAVLDTEPEHFAARLFLAVCAMHQNQPGEAKVGLTACIAQRPYCAWSYQLRGQCEEKLGNAAAAKRDFARAAELQPNLPKR
jgi:serine/threonine protein kinase